MPASPASRAPEDEKTVFSLLVGQARCDLAMNLRVMSHNVARHGILYSRYW